MRVIQAFVQEDATQERFDEVNRVNREAQVRAMSLSFLFLPSVEFLGAAGDRDCTVVWWAGRAR